MGKLAYVGVAALTADAGAWYDLFEGGWTDLCAISADGKILVLANKDVSNRYGVKFGAVAVFYFDGDIYNLAQVIQPDLDSTSTDADFGTSIALSYNGDFMVIGASKLDLYASNAGWVGVYKFNHIEQTYGLHQELKPSDIDPVAGDVWGWAVDISGDGNTIIAAHSEIATQGVQVFRWNGGTEVYDFQTYQGIYSLPAPSGFDQYVWDGHSLGLNYDGTRFLWRQDEYLTDWDGDQGEVWDLAANGTATILRYAKKTATPSSGAGTAGRYKGMVASPDLSYLFVANQSQDNGDGKYGYIEVFTWGVHATDYDYKQSLPPPEAGAFSGPGEYPMALSWDNKYLVSSFEYNSIALFERDEITGLFAQADFDGASSPKPGSPMILDPGITGVSMSDTGYLFVTMNGWDNYRSGVAIYRIEPFTQGQYEAEQDGFWAKESQNATETTPIIKQGGTSTL